MITDKPEIKKEIAIGSFHPNYHIIFFWASLDALDDVSQFGSVEKWTATPDWYAITVDARYDFDEVIAYINNYDSEEIK